MPAKRKSDSSSSFSNTSLSELLSRLTLAASSNDFERVVAISNEVLQSSPNDSRAARQKIIALIKLDKYKDALAFLDECTFLNKNDTILERGFCLYKLGKGSEAEKVLKEGSGRAIQHVRAQNAYRMEDFATSVKLYAELEQSNGVIDQEAEDIATNFSAARAQNTWTTGIGIGDEQNAQDSYEVCFNLAYELIASGKLVHAEEALNRAEKLCSRSGLSGDELKSEQGIILTQLAFIKQLLETKTGQAMKLYDDVQNQPSVDSATRAIALNNKLSIEPRANPFETHRLHAAAAHAFASSKPFLTQSLPFSANSLLLSKQAHKSKNSAEIKRHRKLYPFDYSVSSIQLYLELDGLSETALLKKLDAVFHRDETDVAVGLMLVQVQMQKGNIQMAAATLEKLLHALKDVNEIKYSPGLVSLAVLLFPKVGKDDKATAFLMDAKTYWNSKGNLNANVAALVNHAILARIDQLLTYQPSPVRTQELDAMIAEQKDYLKDHPSDVCTRAVLAALYSAHSPSDSTYAHYSSSLPPISSFTKTVDSQYLESQGIPTVATLQIRQPISRSRPRKHRVRGGKTFDPTQEVDPERWLPLRERSYYKPSKSKKRKTGGATQGGATEAENMSGSGSGHVEIKKADAKKKKKGRK